MSFFGPVDPVGGFWSPDNTSLIIIGTTAERTAYTPVEGQHWYDSTLDRDYAYSGSEWVPIADYVGWTNYTPTITCSDGSSVSLGSGGDFNQAGRYTQHGKTGIAQVYMRWGNTGTQFGTGQYRIGLPWTTDGSSPPAFRPSQGQIYLSTAAGVITAHSAEAQTGAAYFIVRITDGTGAAIASGPSTPFAWANGAYIAGQVICEIA